jgi:hypothetical protein
MRRRLRDLLAFAVVAGLSAAASAKEEQVWTLSGLKDKKADAVTLEYGMPETDWLTVIFSCKPGSGAVDVFVAETSVKLKPGRKATATLAAGSAKATFPGKLLVNEEAGAPSFRGLLPASDAIFPALAGGGTLTITVGPAKSTAPLKDAAEKARKFTAACAKP